MKIALLYGSSTGRTRAAAERIRHELASRLAEQGDENPGTAVCLDVKQAGTDGFVDADLLIVGASTWSVGELQEDWERLFPQLANVDLSGRRVALFGLGDQRNYRDTFVDAMGILHDTLCAQGAQVDVGHCSTDGYGFRESRAVRDGRFCGLALDDDNQPELTASRIRCWCDQLCAELAKRRERAA